MLYLLFSISWFAPLCEIDHIVIHQKLAIFWKDFIAPFNFSFQETFCAFSSSPRRRWIWSRVSPTSSNVSPSSTYFSWLAATYLSLIIFTVILRKSNLQKFQRIVIGLFENTILVLINGFEESGKCLINCSCQNNFFKNFENEFNFCSRYPCHRIISSYPSDVRDLDLWVPKGTKTFFQINF